MKFVFIAAALCASTVHAASFRTANFVISADDPVTARVCAQASEFWYHEHAKRWLGKDLPNLRQPCVVRVVVDTTTGSGDTSWNVVNGTAQGITGTWRGERGALLHDTIPHEVMHVVLAVGVAPQIPRPLNEGVCSVCESAVALKRLHANNISLLQTNQAMSFNELFTRTTYGNRVNQIYSQGSSLVLFLLQATPQGKDPRQTYVAFLRAGLSARGNGAWTNAARSVYGFTSLGHMQGNWVTWVGRGSPFTKQLEWTKMPHPQREYVAQIRPPGLMGMPAGQHCADGSCNIAPGGPQVVPMIPNQPDPVVTSKPGPVGPEGPRGADGRDGKDGKDGLPGLPGPRGGVPQLVMGEVRTLQPGAQASASLVKLTEDKYVLNIGIPGSPEPFKLQFLDGQGNVVEEQVVASGGVAQIPAIRLQLQNEVDGRVESATQAVPLGQTMAIRLPKPVRQ